MPVQIYPKLLFSGSSITCPEMSLLVVEPLYTRVPVSDPQPWVCPDIPENVILPKNQPMSGNETFVLLNCDSLIPLYTAVLVFDPEPCFCSGMPESMVSPEAKSYARKWGVMLSCDTFKIHQYRSP